MPSIVHGYEYDVFISYRQKDNHSDHWVTNFVNALSEELDASFKDDISIYFDENPHHGILETHDVDQSLGDKIKCLVFIPIVSQTYCDPKSFAWTHELLAFIDFAKNDEYGLDVKLRGGNVAKRVLPVRIHEIDEGDKLLFEEVTGGIMRQVDFIYRSAGVNRPLLPHDDKDSNLNKTLYRDQINKLANAIKSIITSLSKGSPTDDGKAKAEFVLDGTVKPKNHFLKRSILRIPVWLAIVLVTVAVFAGTWFVSEQDKTGAVVQTRLAVLPFNFHGKEELAYLGSGLMDLISTKISGLGGMHSLDPKIAEQMYKDYSANLLLLRESKDFSDLGVKYIVHGSLVESGERLQLSCNLITSDGELVEKIQFEAANVDKLFTEIDQIVIQLLSTISHQETKSLGSIGAKTTNDFNALGDFLKGEQARRGGAYKDADKLFRSSIQADSSFAMAWLRWWTNSFEIPLYRGMYAEQAKAKEMVGKLKGELTPQLADFATAYELITEGRPHEALLLMESSLSNYGQNVDVLFLLSEIKLHHSLLLNKSALDAREVTDQLSKFDPANVEAMYHKSIFGQIALDYEEIINAMSMIPESDDNYEAARAELKLVRHVQETGTLLDLPVDELTYSGNYLISSFVRLGRLEELPEFINMNREELRNKYEYFEYHDHFLLRLQGKYREAFEKYPDQSMNNNMSFVLLAGLDGSPLTSPMVDSTVAFVYSNYGHLLNSATLMIRTAALLELLTNQEDSVRRRLEKFHDLTRRNKRAFDHDSITQGSYLQNDGFYKLRSREIRLAKYLIDKKFGDARASIDSILNEPLHRTGYTDYTYYYFEIKMVQAELLLKSGKFEEAKRIFEILDERYRVSDYFKPEFIGPLQFKLAFVYDKLNDRPQALRFYKIFYKLYKDCDPFYQDNVKHAKRRIEEIERMQLRPK